MNKFIGILVIFIGIAVGLWWTQQPTPAPALEMTTIEGEKIRLHELPGPALVVFWATDCPACLREQPLLARLHRDFGDQGLTILAIAMPYDPPNRVVTFAKQVKPPYPIFLDPLGDIARAFGDVRLVPTQFLIADGKILWQKTGALEETEIRNRIETLLHSSKQGAA